MWVELKVYVEHVHLQKDSKVVENVIKFFHQNENVKEIALSV